MRNIEILLILICFSLAVKADEDDVEKYFVNSSGNEIIFQHLKQVTNDSVIYFSNGVTASLALNDILEYHYLKPGNQGRGAAIGMASGLIIGGIIGSTSEDENLSSSPTTILPQTMDNTKTRSILKYAGIGALVGGVVGALIGGASKTYIDNDLRKYSKEEKRQWLLSNFTLHA